MTAGQWFGVATIVLVTAAFALDSYQRRWTRSRAVRWLYTMAACTGAAGLAHWLVSIGAWRLLAALAVLASFAAIAVGLAAIYVQERGQ